MSRITLRHLTLADKEEFTRAMNEAWEENFTFVHYWESLANKNFEKYVEIAPRFSDLDFIPKGHVPATALFAFNSEGEIIGRTSIRHVLNDHLLKEGGHIGYGVCPSKRRLSYATEILKESLMWIKINLPHLKEVLVTCDAGNIGSEKTILKNKGVLENTITLDNGVSKKRFWISIL